jgi:hypothetical protein
VYSKSGRPRCNTTCTNYKRETNKNKKEKVMKKDEWLDEFWQDEIENTMRRRIDQLIESLHFLCRIIAKTDSIHIEQAYQTDLVHKYREYIDIYIKELKSIRKNGYKTLAMPLNHHVSTKSESFGEHTYVAMRDEDGEEIR